MTTDLLKPELSFLNNMDLPHKNAWAPFSNYALQLHMDFHGFKWLISFCACSFQISIIMFIFLYRLTGGDDHADQRGKACLKCFCDTFDSDRCMNSLTRRWMSICSRSMVIQTQLHGLCRRSSSSLAVLVQWSAISNAVSHTLLGNRAFVCFCSATFHTCLAPSCVKGGFPV